MRNAFRESKGKGLIVRYRAVYAAYVLLNQRGEWAVIPRRDVPSHPRDLASVALQCLHARQPRGGGLTAGAGAGSGEERVQRAWQHRPRQVALPCRLVPRPPTPPHPLAPLQSLPRRTQASPL
eukprot:953377-Rhodomonas_salina.4